MSNILINEDSLIVLVQQNDLLYNKNNREYKNTQKKREVWEAIGSQIGASGEACSKRWASLRDKYCREVRKMASSSGSGAIAGTKWQYFEALPFLSGHMRGGRQRSNFSLQTEEALFPPWDCLEDSDISAAVTASSPLPSPVLTGFSESLPSTSSGSRKRKREAAQDEFEERFLNISKSLECYLEKEEVASLDNRAHRFGQFVETCLTGMEERQQMKYILEITQFLSAAQNDK